MAEAAPVTTAEKAPRFTAKLRNARIAPRKMRYVVDLIRGKDFNSAIAILRVCPKRGAMFCKKLLESAYENAMDLARNRNLDVDGNKLHLVEARVDPGPTMKRWRPSSVRRPTQILKRMCHVIFALEERELKEGRRDRARRQKQERQKRQAEEKAAKKAATAGEGTPKSKKEDKPSPPKGSGKKGPTSGPKEKK